jgi:hypothetical protein
MLGSLANNKLERISKGLIMTYLKYFAGIFPEVLRKTMKKNRTIYPQGLQNMKQDC